MFELKCHPDKLTQNKHIFKEWNVTRRGTLDPAETFRFWFVFCYYYWKRSKYRKPNEFCHPRSPRGQVVPEDDIVPFSSYFHARQRQSPHYNTMNYGTSNKCKLITRCWDNIFTHTEKCIYKWWTNVSKKLF